MGDVGKLVRSAFFVMLAAAMSAGIVSLYGFTDNVHSKAVFDNFYALPKNSIDVIWIGPSSVQEYFIPSEAYERAGIAAYGLNTGNQPFVAAKYLMEECEKTQDPCMYLIDVRQLLYADDISRNAVMRVTSNMQPGSSREAAIDGLRGYLSLARLRKGASQEEAPEEEDARELYEFDFLLFHSRRDITSRDFGHDPSAFLSYWGETKVQAMDGAAVQSRLSLPEKPLGESEESMLREVLAYCDGLGKRVVFTCTPNCLGEEYFSKANYAKRVISSRGYEVLDLNDHIAEMGIDYAKDFKNDSHVNVWGAVKLTDYVASWIAAQGLTADHSDDDRYQVYSDTQARFEEWLSQQERSQ